MPISMPIKWFIRVVILTVACTVLHAQGYLSVHSAPIVFGLGLLGLALVACAEWVMAAGKDEAEQEEKREQRRLQRRGALLKKPADD